MGSLLTKAYAFFAGLGYVEPPDPGNRANAPADPPVQQGNYQWLQMPADWTDNRTTNIENIPPAYRDLGNYAVPVFGLSGLEGGGSTGDVPELDNGTILYYDNTTGTYKNVQVVYPGSPGDVDLSSLEGVSSA
jgi:hypothetical protein